MSASQHQQQPNQVDLKQKIRENMEFLKKNTLRLKMLVSELVSCDLLTFDQADAILEQPNHITMHEKMYTFLMEEPSSQGMTTAAAYAKLLKALRSSGNGHLVEALQK